MCVPISSPVLFSPPASSAICQATEPAISLLTNPGSFLCLRLGSAFQQLLSWVTSPCFLKLTSVISHSVSLVLSPAPFLNPLLFSLYTFTLGASHPTRKYRVHLTLTFVSLTWTSLLNSRLIFPKAHLASISSWILCSFSIGSMINYHKISALKQHPFIMSHCLWVRSLGTALLSCVLCLESHKAGKNEGNKVKWS